MARFMVLYQSDNQAVELMAKASAEEMKAGMDEWMKWFNESGGEKVIEWGLPLQPRKHVAQDGQTSSSHSNASGYSIITADSLEDVLAIIKNHPHLARAGSSMEVLELLPMPGM